MPATLSVVIAARNCADRIAGTVLPWKGIATEIVVADQMSTDQTPQIAQELGCVVLRNDPPNGNFNLNRKIGMEKANSDWILYIDTDERPTPELLEEIKDFLEIPLDGDEPAGVKIPNFFYFLGKPLMHGIYSPRGAEIRLMRREKWDYPTESSVHIGVSVRGKVIRFKNAYKHFNINSLSEWFSKTNQYTEHDTIAAFAKVSDARSIPTYGAFYRAFRFFIRHYFLKRGFLDGFHGLVSVFYFMLYHLTFQIKVWERAERQRLKEEQDYLKPFETQLR
ncbi:MAG: glycosyltransferase family 2 protein [Bdellovibrionota bacterium]